MSITNEFQAVKFIVNTYSITLLIIGIICFFLTGNILIGAVPVLFGLTCLILARYENERFYGDVRK